jgi:hypothetical protein
MFLNLLKNNKNFWEELIAYFPWYDTGHVENDASNNSSIVAYVFVNAGTFLPSRCLQTTGGTLTEPLPSNDKGDTKTHAHRQQQRSLISPLLFFQNKGKYAVIKRLLRPVNLEMVQFVDLRKCYAQTVLTFWTTLVYIYIIERGGRGGCVNISKDTIIEVAQTRHSVSGCSSHASDNDSGRLCWFSLRQLISVE